MNKLRVGVAFLLAPVLPCAGYVIALASTADEIGHPLVITAAEITVVAIAWGVIVGLPMLVGLTRWWKIGGPQCVLAGAVSAVLLQAARLIAAAEVPEPGHSMRDQFLATSLAAGRAGPDWAAEGQLCLELVLLGCAIGFCFWVLAFWGGGDTPSVLATGQA